jgi:two-component system, NtrC family, C4-dicarboxylate transport sensor histidine kinase DctB
LSEALQSLPPLVASGSTPPIAGCSFPPILSPDAPSERPELLLVAANRAAVYGQVARWLIHDLRNPAQALTLITELMSGEPDPAVEAARRSVIEATTHLTRSLELLDRALRAPSRSADRGPVSLSDILRFLGSLHRVHRSSIQLDLRPALAMPLPAVIGAEDHLEHALLNLVVNALEAFGARPEGRIAFGAEVDGTRLTLHITDDGPGVAEAIRPRLFEPFTTTKRDGPSAGLGLAVARKLLGWYGGDVRYVPTDRPGASFAADFAIWGRR